MFLKKREWQWATRLPVCKVSRSPQGSQERRGSGHEGQAAGRRGDRGHARFPTAEAPQPAEVNPDHAAQRGRGSLLGRLPSGALIRELSPLPVPAHIWHQCSWALGQRPSGRAKNGIRTGHILPRKEWPIFLSLWGQTSLVLGSGWRGFKSRLWDTLFYLFDPC